MIRIVQWFATALLLGFAGCGGSHETALGKTARQLHTGMTRQGVDSLLSDFNPSEGTGFEGWRVGKPKPGDPMVYFQTNVDRGTRVSYWPRSLGVFDSFECCYVYFDTNGVIVAYEYSRDK